MDSSQYAALKTEITTDPATLGYNGKGDEAVANLLNKANRQINREIFDGGLLASCIVVSEYAALTPAAARQYVDAMCGAVNIPFSDNLKTQVLLVFTQAAAPLTRANIVAMAKRTGTRGEELLFGLNITPSDVANAKALP